MTQAMTTAVDERLMARALRLAARGLYTTDPNPRVGCVVARDDKVLGEGWHAAAGEEHAEAIALRRAGSAARGATAYITLEPCCHHGRTPPCTDALIEAGVARVVCALRDPDPRVAGRGFEQLEAAGIRVDRLDCMAPEARALNIGFIKRMTTGRPWVRVKLATSMDGRTALSSGASRWITGEAARRDVHRWRARSSCLLTGSGTVLADDPSLNMRLDAADLGLDRTPRQPWLAIADGRLRTPPHARLFKHHDRVLILTTATAAANAQALATTAVEVVATTTDAAGHPDARAMLQELARRACNEVHVEAGPELCGGLLATGLVDELLLYMAPQILGHDARGAFAIPELQSMDERIRLHVQEVRSVGPDLRIRALPIVDRDHERR
jgi:diaminohydroxyphosphoribosylaminopyrimidine deaminase / 5-amino-6-(5-phosphoribosylamino)uracil reductase